MRFGLDSKQHRFISETVVEPLSALGAQVYCYGSRARGDHSPFSDLDLMVEAQEEETEKLRREISRIEELVENSLFPFKLDLVLLTEFASAYRDSYEKDKVAW